MMKIIFGKTGAVFLALLLAAFLTLPVEASQVTAWSGSASGRTLNDTDFAGTLAMLQGAGYTVGPNAAITAQVLAITCVLFINEAPLAPSADELTLLTNWIAVGGRLFVSADSGGVGVATGNLIFGGVGSSLAFNVSSPLPAPPISAGPFSTGLVGQSLATSPAASVTGGTAIAGNYIRYQQLGSGYVVASGDAFYHPALGGDDSGSVNGELLLNICAAGSCTQTTGGGGGGGNTVPEPATLVIIPSGLLALAAVRRRRITI